MLNQRALGHAAYQRGDVYRLRGEFEAAEAAFARRRASGESRSRASRCCGGQGKRDAAALGSAERWGDHLSR